MRLLTRLNERWAVFALLAATLTFWVGFALNWRQTGWDFPMFYITGGVPTHSVYDGSAFAAYWKEHLAPLGVTYWSRFMRPPVFSLLLRPLVFLSYSNALWVWMAAGLLSYLLSVAILISHFRLPRWLLIPYTAFFPGMVGFISGQDNCFVLLSLILGWMMLQRNRDTLAGIAFALCLYKFNLVILVPVMLACQQRFRALGSLAVGASFLAGASLLITPLRTYLRAILDAPKQTAGFFPFGLRGLGLVLANDYFYPVSALIVILICCWLMRRLPLGEAFCIAITGALLVVPYVCWYDSTLLAIPIALTFARGSGPIRIACVALLFLGPAWRFLLTHVATDLFVLAFLLSRLQTSLAAADPQLPPVPVRAAHV
jgi:hypothetical protein